MPKHDFLKKQIDQLGLVLEKLLADLLGSAQKGQLEEALQSAEDMLIAEIASDSTRLVEMHNNDFLHFLQNDRQVSTDSLNKLADILLFIADTKPDNDPLKATYYNKCLLIYETAEKSDSIFSLDNYLKSERILGWQKSAKNDHPID